MRMRYLLPVTIVLSMGLFPWPGWDQPPKSSPPVCRIDSMTFDGWKAEQISNEWVRLIIVPQLGGRLMQVTFGDHPFLFVNEQYKGQYFPPSEGAAKHRWFNYGGDKIWPLPEGTQDEQHWAGPVSDVLDDGVYALKILSQGANCGVRLEGPPDPRTGLQYSREISIGSDSPEISFHAVMKNSTDHPIQWAMQSVTQYDTADPKNSGGYNHDFWAFAPTNPHSAYFGRYHVRSGLAEDPSYEVRDGLFTLHWLYLQSEVWVDSPYGWVAVVDDATHFAMVERFHFREGADYPGDATVIFYKNGPALELDDKGLPFITSSKPEDTLRYMEAELNSPMVRLDPGDTYAMDTEWFPTRMAGDFKTVTDAGVVGKYLTASFTANGIALSSLVGVYFPGKLEARLYDRRGVEAGVVRLQSVSPLDLVNLQQEIQASPATARVSIRLVDQRGYDRGSLGEAWVTRLDGGS